MKVSITVTPLIALPDVVMEFSGDTTLGEIHKQIQDRVTAEVTKFGYDNYCRIRWYETKHKITSDSEPQEYLYTPRDRKGKAK